MIQDSELIVLGNSRKVALKYEVANSAESTQAPDSRELIRPDSPDVKIVSVQLKQGRDKAAQSYTIKDPITAEITIDVSRPIEVQFNLFILQNNEYLAGINSTEGLKRYKPRIGRHVIKCTIQPGQLAKGDYSVGLGLYTLDSVPKLIDIIDSSYSNSVAPRLTIVNSSPYKDGKFYIHGKWTHA
jgi:hypothetical protein